MFCPKCSAILMPKKEGKKIVTKCSCGYKAGGDSSAGVISEKVKDKSKQVEVVDEAKDLDALPKMEVECPKCGHREAGFWEVQTRASDEPPTKFMKCLKCKHTWRDYL